MPLPFIGLTSGSSLPAQTGQSNTTQTALPDQPPRRNECADPAQTEANKLLVTAVPVLVAKANANLLDKVGISEFGVVSIATVASATALVPADDPLNAGMACGFC